MLKASELVEDPTTTKDPGINKDFYISCNGVFCADAHFAEKIMKSFLAIIHHNFQKFSSFG